jgi:putative ATP-binding cassette transporter
MQDAPAGALEIDRWLSDRRFYQLSIAGDPAKNPEYRIADDVRMATEPLVSISLPA